MMKNSDTRTLGNQTIWHLWKYKLVGVFETVAWGTALVVIGIAVAPFFAHPYWIWISIGGFLVVDLLLYMRTRQRIRFCVAINTGGLELRKGLKLMSIHWNSIKRIRVDINRAGKSVNVQVFPVRGPKFSLISDDGAESLFQSIIEQRPDSFKEYIEIRSSYPRNAIIISGIFFMWIFVFIYILI